MSKPHTTEFDGCAYGSQNPEEKVMRKTWKVVSSYEKVKGYLNKDLHM